MHAYSQLCIYKSAVFLQTVGSQNTAAKNYITKKERSKSMSATQTCTIVDLTNEPSEMPVEGHSKRKFKKLDNWLKVEDITLTAADRDTILHPTAWLTDNIIAAGQRQLQMQTGTSGLQPTWLGQTCCYDIQKGDFVQVVHDGYGHWLTISTLGVGAGVIDVYDSLYESVSSYVENQVAAIVFTETEDITLNFIDVQKQTGTCDCGLFALAFATALTTGCSPERLHFDQGKMRRHLYRCLENGAMENFPIVKQRQPKNRIKSTHSFTVHCTCRMPEDRNMVECCGCRQWYHVPCVNVPLKALEDSNEPWYCEKC